MRVDPIGFTTPVLQKTRSRVAHEKPQEPVAAPIAFKGHLKFGDYLVGAICGGAMAAVGFAVAGPIGAIALGTLGAKTTAEANNDTRKENYDKKD